MKTGAEITIDNLIARVSNEQHRIVSSKDNEGLLVLRGRPEDILRMIQEYRRYAEDLSER